MMSYTYYLVIELIPVKRYPLSIIFPHLIAQDGITVHLEKVEVLLNITPPYKGHQVQKTDGIEA